MLFDILGGGLIVAFGLLVTFLKCPWKIRMWMLSHPLTMDILIFILLNILHWGTFTGVMVASCGAATCSLMISFGRRLWGWIDKRNQYHKGVFDVYTYLTTPASTPPPPYS